MQTFITDTNMRKSASNLDQKRLNAQIYKAIHILASLTGLNDKLINPKRDVSNHPAAKLWKGYENELSSYIIFLMLESLDRKVKKLSLASKPNFEKDKAEYEFYNSINYKNFRMIIGEKNPSTTTTFPPFVTDELIQTHRSVLYKKNNEFYKQWENVPKLDMGYDWR